MSFLLLVSAMHTAAIAIIIYFIYTNYKKVEPPVEHRGGVLTDHDIHDLCVRSSPMIYPYVGKATRFLDNGSKVISYGRSSAGYDVRLKAEAKIFSNVHGRLIDPKQFDEANLVDATIHEENGEKFVVLPPHSYLLAPTVEYFDIPKDVIVICLGKSTYARSAVIVNATPIEPGFKGEVVIEVLNSCSIPVKVYLEEGIAQFIFLRGNRECHTSYEDKGGKYQGQTGITLPKS